MREGVPAAVLVAATPFVVGTQWLTANRESTESRGTQLGEWLVENE